MIIQLRAAPTAPPPMAIPMAQPVERSVQTAIPVATPPAPVSEPVALGDAGPIVRARKGPKRRDWLTYSLLILGFIVLVGLGVGAAIIQMGGGPKILGGANTITSTDLNLKFEPPSGWDMNKFLRDKMQVSLLAMQRNEPAAWFALDARDFKDHEPTPKELDDEARARLKGYFQNLETEPGRGAPLKASDPIAEQPTHVIVFQGEIDGEHYAGECHAFRFQGIGYWVFAWKKGTAEHRSDDEFPKMRRRVALLGDRAKWKELESRRQVFTGSKVKGYTLTDATSRWKEQDEPESYDPKADLVLFATDPKNPKLRTQGVALMVLVLPKAEGGVDAARAYILDKQKKDSYEMTQIADAYEDGSGPKEGLGETSGKLLRWRIQNTPERARFAVVGVVPHGSDLLVLYGECDYERRNTWEGQLQTIIETIKLQN